MKVLDLYKFIKNNSIEWHWIDDNNDVVIFLDYSELYDFRDLLTSSDFDDEGIKCNLKDGYVAICLKDLLENHDIELSEIFTENENEF